MRTIYDTTRATWADTRYSAKQKWLQQLRAPSTAIAGRLCEPPTRFSKFHDTKLITLQKIITRLNAAGFSAGIQLPQIIAGQALLQADDGTWHRLRLATDEGMVRPDVEQIASAAPPLSFSAYLPMQGGDGFTYRVGVKMDENVVHLEVDDTQRSELGLASCPLINITDLLTYSCTVVIDEGKPHFSPAQTP